MRYALVLLLAGCSTGAEADWPRVPAAYAPLEPVARPAVQGRFPIDLPTVLRLAGANSLEIAFVREKVNEARARAQLAEERLWPAFGPEFSFRRHEDLTQATDGTFVDVDKQQTFLGLRAGLRWDIGEAIFSTLAASRRVEAADSALQATREGVLLEAAQAYYDLVREHLRERVAEASAGVSEKLAAELDVSFQAGRGFKGDVLRARVQHASSRLGILRAREGMKVAALRLGNLLRLTPGIELYPAEAIPQPLALVPPGAKDEDLLQEALRGRPEIREGERELEASRRDEDAATWAPLVPTLQADAAPGRLGPVLSDLESSEDYALTLGWRLGPGGLLDPGRRRLAQAKTRQAEIHVERLKQRVTEQVLSSLARLRAKDDQIKLAESAVRDAEEALKLNQERQAANIGLPLEVLQAEEALSRARLDYYMSVVDYNQAQLRAFTHVGRSRASR